MTKKYLQKDLWQLIKTSYAEYKHYNIKINPYLFTYEVLEKIERDNNIKIDIMDKQKMYNRFCKKQRELYSHFLLFESKHYFLNRPKNKNR